MAWLSFEGFGENSPARSQEGAVPGRIEPTFWMRDTSAPAPEPSDAEIRTVHANEFLFRPGDPRTHVFRVETGAVCLYENRPTDRQLVVEFLFPGDFVGLGFLEKHCLSARALVQTTVRCLTIDAAAEIIREDQKAKAKLAAAVEREFEIRRDELHVAGQRQPLERVAALLVTSARTNVQQGRAAALIEDSWRCGVIADLLRLSLDDLSAILIELERRGLIETAAGGLRLLDIAALEALADGMRPVSNKSVASHGKPVPASKVPPAYKAA
jgi:CRP/FNR family transcriptional regulator